MTRIFPILLFIGLAWGQDNFKKEFDFDKLVSKGGTIFFGEFSRIEKSVVYFKPTKASAFQGVPINQVQSLKLKDGKVIIKNGNVLSLIKVKNYEKLSLEEKAIYDAKSDAGRWILYPPVALGTFGAMMLGSNEEPWEDLAAIFAISAASLAGPYYLFSRLDRKPTQNLKLKDEELYEKIYFKEFRKRKLINIIASSIVTCTLGPILYFSSVSSGLGNYDVCFDPRCD
tara:strand:- start:1282 stop:1965 length:684 start_codon:yes stop_codon:yes gene_type:complete